MPIVNLISREFDALRMKESGSDIDPVATADLPGRAAPSPATEPEANQCWIM
jgi:hypothetical protein